MKYFTPNSTSGSTRSTWRRQSCRRSLGQGGSRLQGAAREYPGTHAVAGRQAFRVVSPRCPGSFSRGAVAACGEFHFFEVTVPAAFLVGGGGDHLRYDGRGGYLAHLLPQRSHHHERAPEGWRFSKLQEQWLYDEVDMMNDRRGLFVHRILLSTGLPWRSPSCR